MTHTLLMELHLPPIPTIGNFLHVSGPPFFPTHCAPAAENSPCPASYLQWI